MITVTKVTTKAQLRKFVTFPSRLYQDCPQFVPSMYGDDLSDWDKNKNPAFSYSEAECFLAYNGEGEIVGRIGAILSHRSNEKWNTSRMRFTQVDFIDDYDVSEALFRAVENWAKEKGCTEVHGPLGWSDLDREGMLCEGYDRRNMFITYYNAPYYHDHLRRLGYAKDVDWIEYKITVPPEGDPYMMRVEKLAEFCKNRYHLHTAVLKHRKDYNVYLRKVFKLVNEAYAPLYGVVPLTEEQQMRYAKKFIPMVDPDYACFVMDEDDNMVGFGVCAPSMANALKKSNGKLFPFGWMGVLHALKKNDAIDMFLIACRPDMQKKGVNAIIMNHIFKSCKKNGIRWAETGPQLETNENVLSQWTDIEKDLHKRRRCYIKKLV